MATIPPSVLLSTVFLQGPNAEGKDNWLITCGRNKQLGLVRKNYKDNFLGFKEFCSRVDRSTGYGMDTLKTTFWLSFTDTGGTGEKRFLGVAIFDMDESAGPLSMTDIIKHAWALGLNPGGAASVQEVSSIPDEHKNKLITDEALLLSLGSRGWKRPN
jgi:hypothetical protein